MSKRGWGVRKAPFTDATMSDPALAPSSSLVRFALPRALNSRPHRTRASITIGSLSTSASKPSDVDEHGPLFPLRTEPNRTQDASSLPLAARTYLSFRHCGAEGHKQERETEFHGGVGCCCCGCCCKGNKERQISPCAADRVRTNQFAL